MHCSVSFRAFVLVGVVTLVAAFCQSTPCSAFTVTTGLTSRQRVELGFPLNVSFELDEAGRFRGHFLFAPSPLGVERGRLGAEFSHTRMPFLATRSYSSGAAEVAAKTVASWSNAFGIIDAPNDDQCGMFDVGAPNYDQSAPNESAALLEAFKLIPVRIRHRSSLP